MHPQPKKETDLDSSDARFEAADLNGGRADEEATWFCSDVMAGVAGQPQLRSSVGTGPESATPTSTVFPHLWTRPIALQTLHLAVIPL